LDKIDINIVWFKRDLRFTDHEPLYTAQQQEIPLLLIYCFEPSLIAYDDSDVRHWRFVYESLQEMQKKLKKINGQLYSFHNEAQTVFTKLAEWFNIKTVFSHQEIGNKISYDRDIAISKFFKEKNINWKEYQTNGIIRRLKSRSNWDERWQQKMTEFPKLVNEEIGISAN
jgi:deoxyribodipyrimidine photo-lyase